jgi:hypothetical protein
VAGTRHLSPRRAGGGFAAAALGATAVAAPLLGSDPWALMNVETGFALLSASYLAGKPGSLWLPLQPCQLAAAWLPAGSLVLWLPLWLPHWLLLWLCLLTAPVAA